MVWWEWPLVFGMPTIATIVAVILGLLLGKFLTSDRKKKINWWSFPTKESREGLPCIAFDQFLDMYKINPDKWNIYYDEFNKRSIISYYTNHEYQRLYWKTHRDQRRCNRWVRQRNKEKTIKESNKILTTILTDVQKDVQKEIERRQKEYDKEIERINKEKEMRQREYEMLRRYPSVPTSNNVSYNDLHNHVATIVKQEAPIAEINAIKLYPDDNHKYYYMGKPVTIFKTTDGKTFIENEEGLFEEVINCSFISATAAVK